MIVLKISTTIQHQHFDRTEPFCLGLIVAFMRLPAVRRHHARYPSKNERIKEPTGRETRDPV